MQIIALVCLFVAGATASGYGEPTVVRIESAAPVYSTVRELPSYAGYGATVVKSQIPIISYNQEIRGGLSDSTSFETGNGIRSSESTQIVAGRGGSYDDGYGKMVKSDSSVIKTGSYSYIAADGTPISLSYVADENGFRATGSHLPTPPPVPAEIAESLRLTASSAYGSSYSAPAVLVRSSVY